MILADAAATEAVGFALAGALRAGDVVTLAGELGAGKTTLARGLLRGLGLEGEAASPSFAIVIGYAPPEVWMAVDHVDLYRIEDPGEAAELGLDEIGADGVLLVEWPERLGEEAWAHALRLNLTTTPEGARRLTWGVPAAWEGRWPPPPFHP